MCPAQRRPPVVTTPPTRHRGAGDPFSKPQPLGLSFLFARAKIYFPFIIFFLNFLLWKNFKYSKIEILMP